MRITIVAGNPKPDSRTLDAGRVVARAFGRDVGEIDVIGLGPGLLSWGDPGVRDVVHGPWRYLAAHWEPCPRCAPPVPQQLVAA